MNRVRLWLFIFFLTILASDLFYVLNSRFDYVSTRAVAVQAFLILSAVGKALFFLPIAILFFLGNIFGYGGDYFYIPDFWYPVTYIAGVLYAYYLSRLFTDPKTRIRTIWNHITLLIFYLIILGTLMIVWHFNQHSIISPQFRAMYVFLIGGFCVYASIPLIIYIGKRLIK